MQITGVTPYIKCGSIRMELRIIKIKKSLPKSPSGPLHPIAVHSMHFQALGMNLSHPFPTSPDQNNEIVVYTDYRMQYVDPTAHLEFFIYLYVRRQDVL